MAGRPWSWRSPCASARWRRSWTAPATPPRPRSSWSPPCRGSRRSPRWCCCRRPAPGAIRRGRPPGPGNLRIALGSGLAVALGSVLLGLPVAGVALMIPCAGFAALALTRLARSKIGGQTGDVIGACQQLAEIAALLALVAALAD
nr:adenosylcobinamide-GDP ribazoletransferase [Methylobacterium sp. WL1]